MNNEILSFNHVSFAYEKEDIIKNLSLSINQGEFVSFLGPSGSGKSTIFRLITGLEQPYEGEILLHGTSKSRMGEVGYMPQKDLLLEWRTVLQNVLLPFEIQGKLTNDNKKKAIQMLEEFGLKGYENSFPAQLSGGMRQRVSFLRAMLSGSNLLILDEPFSALDAIKRLTMQEWLLEQWEKYKKTIIFITHDVDEALFLSDRIFLFSEIHLTHYKEITVPTKRPRQLEDLLLPEVSNVKKQLLQQLRKQVTL